MLDSLGGRLNAKLGVNLTGLLGSFNIFVAAALVFCLSAAVLLLTLGPKEAVIPGLLFLAIVTVIIVVSGVGYYFRGSPRPLDGNGTYLVANNGKKAFTLVNPPDSFYEDDHVRAILRQCLVGYDENLCADGEVIGNAADGEVRLFSTEEKREFIRKHAEEVKAKRRAAADNLAITSQPPTEPSSRG